MNLSDFLIRGRHLFGFLVPGVMWLCIVGLAVTGEIPLSFIEEGENSLVRAISVLTLGYVIGFCLQTIFWSPIVDPLMRRVLDELDASTIKPLTEYAESIFKAQLSAPDKQDEVLHSRVGLLCKLYVLENSQELRKVLLEKEADINFLVAILVPGPLLLMLWTWFTTDSLLWTFGSAVLALWMGIRLVRSLRRYLKKEREEWLETFIVLQLKKPSGGTAVPIPLGHA